MFGAQRQGLTDDQRLILSTVDGLMTRFGEEYWERLDSEGEYPQDFVKELEKMGLAAAAIPAEYGGAGYGIKESSLILEEINAKGGNAQPLHGQFYLSFVLSRGGSPGMKEKYLRPIAEGKLRMQSFALTEPEAGSESTRIKTSAKRDGSKYVIDGRKIFISRVEQTDLMVLAARTKPYDSVTKKTDGITLFLVDMRVARGIEKRRIETMFNSQTYELAIEGLEVPEENVIGEVDKGFSYMLQVLNPERLLIASECIGDAKWFIEKGASYSKERIVFGRPLAANQGVQFPLAEAYCRLAAADRLRWAGIELYDGGAPPSEVGAYANMAKYLAAESSWQAANVAMDIYGGYGVAVGTHIERKFRETRLYRVAPISQNLALAYVAEQVLGLPRSYPRG